MGEPFWQRSLSAMAFDDLAAFIDERIPEGDQLEYKLPTYNKQNDKFEFTSEFLETVVAFANAGGGFIIYGIREDGAKRPESIEGVRIAPAKTPRDPAEILRDTCATQIDPAVSLDTRVLDIPPGEQNAGNKVLLARVRRGLLPPYNLLMGRGQGIFIRNGDHDVSASVREIAELLGRRSSIQLPAQTLWARVVSRTFTHESQHIKTAPPFLMCAVTPAFPITPVGIDEQTDEAFKCLCLDLFQTDAFIAREPDGVMFDRYSYDQQIEHPPAAYATADGSMGVRISVAPGTERGGTATEPWPLPIVDVWRLMRRILRTSETWPRGVCDYGGPLVCRISLGNLAQVVVALPSTWPHVPTTTLVNRQPGWPTETEWGPGQNVDDLIDTYMASLTRVLQFGYYPRYREAIRAAASV